MDPDPPQCTFVTNVTTYKCHFHSFLFHYTAAENILSILKGGVGASGLNFNDSLLGEGVYCTSLGPERDDSMIIHNNWRDNSRTWKDIAICIQLQLCSRNVYQTDDETRDIFVVKTKELNPGSIRRIILHEKVDESTETRICASVRMSGLSICVSRRERSYPTLRSGFRKHQQCQHPHRVCLDFCNQIEFILPVENEPPPQLQVRKSCIII